MKSIIAFAIIAAATAAVIPQSQYLPPAEVEVIAPIEEVAIESAPLADDGYRYKTIRKLKYRNRRDVSEIAPEYLPPVEAADGYQYNAPAVEEPQQDTAVLADDGYQYKTVRRLKYRKRRDVSEIVAPQYLPPTNEYLPPSEEAAPIEAEPAIEESAPIVEEAEQESAPIVEEPEQESAPIVEEPVQDTAVLADDGYQYKTVRRLKYRYRNRRDVSEIAAAPQYLPPAEEAPAANDAPVDGYQYTHEEPQQDSAVLADDGYQYKTVRRLKYRHRRDVSEIAATSSHYLPPVEEAAAPVEGYQYTPAAEEPQQDTAVLADDGYKYKTVRRLKYRHRRDVSEIAAPAPQYLPAVEESAPIVEEPEQESAILADDGYQYKTVRRLKYRHRRDVSEIAAPAPQYLPAVEESAPIIEEPEQESAILADDGYQYKTVRRLKYRHRRDVSEIAPQYLPPQPEYLPPVEAAVLADDGYQYKQIKKLKYKHRV